MEFRNERSRKSNLEKGRGKQLNIEEEEIYETEPFIRDFDFTFQYLQSLNYLRSDPTLGDIERAHVKFYREQVDDTYGQKGKRKKQVGPIATAPMSKNIISYQIHKIKQM